MAYVRPEPNLAPSSLPWARSITTDVDALKSALRRLDIDTSNNAGSLNTSIGVLAETVAKGAGNVYSKAEVDAKNAADRSYTDTVASGKANSSHTHGANQVTGGTFASNSGYTFQNDVIVNGHVYVPNSSLATASYVVAYINGDGRLSKGASSARFKEDIQAWSPQKQAIMALQLVAYRYKAELFDGEGDRPFEIGLIAEDLDELGLRWLVHYTDGIPSGIAYEKLALALLPLVQDHEARLAALEAKLS